MKLSFKDLNSSISIVLSNFQDGSSIGTDEIIHHDEFNIVKDAPLFRNNAYFSYNGNSRYFEMSPLLPLGMLFIILTVIFILLIFRRWPGLVAGIIAGTLTSVSIYLTLLALKEQKLVYE